MKRWIAVMVLMVGVAGVRQANAQESAAGPGTVNVTVIPGGAAFFVEGKDSKVPSFANYGLGAGVDVNFNRFVGVEAEVTGALGVTQNLQFTSGTVNAKTPNLLNYSGNLVVSAANHSAVVPYVDGRRRRAHGLQPAGGRHRAEPDVPDRQRRRGREVALRQRPLGAARRLPVRRRSCRRPGAEFLRS